MSKDGASKGTNFAARPPRYVQDDIITRPPRRIGRGSVSRAATGDWRLDGVECSLRRKVCSPTDSEKSGEI